MHTMSETTSFKFNHVILDEIIERIADGETLVHVCAFDREGYARDRGTFPTHGTVYMWTYPGGSNYNEEFTVRMAEARWAQQHTWVEQSVDIANNMLIAEEVTEETVDMDGEKPYTKTVTRVSKKDATAHRQMQIATRQKAAAMFNPTLWAAKANATKDDDDDGDVTVHGGLPD